MSCPEHELLSAVADGELERSLRAEIERHLSTCAPCRRFVEEMRDLEACGRSSLRAISVKTRPELLEVSHLSTRRSVMRPIALAAAAVVLVTVSVAVWLIALRTQEPRQVSAPIRAAGGDEFATSSDASFERWAEPYRQLRIPLVPLEEVANYTPPTLLPMLPAPTTRNNENRGPEL